MAHPLDQDLRASYEALLGARVPGHARRTLRWAHGEANAVDVGSGAPLLLVHGGMGQLLQWLPILPSLAAAHRVIAVDRPGQGLSDSFPYDATVDVFEHGSEFLRGVLDALGLEKATLVGNSMGGLWSVALALRHLERVERLVLVGAPAGSRRWIPMGTRVFRIPIVRRALRAAIARGDVSGTRAAFGRTLVVHPERLDEDLLLGMTRATKRNLASTWGLWDAVLTPRGFLRPHLVIGERWRRLAMPVTFIWGDEDAFDTPDHGEELARMVPGGARLLRVRDAGHIPWLDAPERVGEHVLSAAAAAAG
jgi:pimeloyl-ACP methyl ester carboxylesterase